jgi:hypothetical protein
VDEDPVAAWQVHCDGVQAVLDDPETAHRELANPHMGRLPLETAIDQFYTADRAVGRKPCPSGGGKPGLRGTTSGRACRRASRKCRRYPLSCSI